MRKRRLLLVAPRPPRRDGRGDQRRAYEIVVALSRSWSVEVVSWLPDVGVPIKRALLEHPTALARAVALVMVRPVHVAYVQALAPRSLQSRLERHDVVLFVTDRAVPRSVGRSIAVDFVDDLGGAALHRARSTPGPAALFWHWEGWRLRRLDCRLARRAVASFAVSERDAAAISPAVQAIPLSIGTTPMDGAGDTICFTGNLAYLPNHEAAMWICSELSPYLTAAGVDASRIVVAGRRPRPSLRDRAESTGVQLLADVDDLSDTLRHAAVALAPMTIGSGVQYKILDAVGAGRPCVLSPLANLGLGLVDGRSALIRDRRPGAFAAAITELLDDQDLRARLTVEAQCQLARYRPDAVAASWRRCFEELSHGMTSTSPSWSIRPE